MITEQQKEVVRKYVPEKYFDQERLIKYLSLHDMVGVEVFMYVAKDSYEDALRGYETVLPVLFKESWNFTIVSGEGDNYRKIDKFEPEPVDVFVKRIPFNFYHEGDDIRVDENGKETQVWRPVAITNLTYALGDDPMSRIYYHRNTPLTLEDAYNKLEYLFYEKGYTLEQIFRYPDSITWTDSSDMYGDWFDYLDMCLQLGWDDLMPEHFIINII